MTIEIKPPWGRSATGGFSGWRWNGCAENPGAPVPQGFIWLALDAWRPTPGWGRPTAGARHLAGGRRHLALDAPTAGGKHSLRAAVLLVPLLSPIGDKAALALAGAYGWGQAKVCQLAHWLASGWGWGQALAARRSTPGWLAARHLPDARHLAGGKHSLGTARRSTPGARHLAGGGARGHQKWYQRYRFHQLASFNSAI